MEVIFLICLINIFFSASAAPRENSLPFSLTDDEYRRYFGTDKKSAPKYGLAEINLKFGGRSKRSAPNYIIVPMTYSDNERFVANLTRTDGILADANTTIWKASSKPGSGIVNYFKDCEALEKLGPFSFYHDTEHKAALMLIHNTKVLHGYVRNSEFKLRHIGAIPEENKAQQYVLIPFQSQPGNVQVKWNNGTRFTEMSDPPEVVYPQLLISLDQYLVQVGETVAIQQILSYLNGVDMLFRDISYPRIRFRINGIILPQDAFSTPWLEPSRYIDEPYRLDEDAAFEGLGGHFASQGVFNDEDYDIMASFTMYRMAHEGTTLGLATVGADCRSKKSRIAIISRSFVEYHVAAHEFGHLFGVPHEEKMNCPEEKGTIMGAYFGNWAKKFQWSRCAQMKMSFYFSSPIANCYINNPFSKEVCKSNTIRKP